MMKFTSSYQFQIEMNNLMTVRLYIHSRMLEYRIVIQLLCDRRASNSNEAMRAEWDRGGRGGSGAGGRGGAIPGTVCERRRG